MEHPLINDVNELTVDQLQSRISDLNKKLNFAARSGNASLVGQLQMALETFNNCYREKLQDQYNKGNNNPDFSEKIDIS
jgi:hypothetical protein